MNDNGAAEIAPELDDTATNHDATKALSATATGETMPAPPNRTGKVDSSHVGSEQEFPKIVSHVGGSARIGRGDPTSESAVRAR